MANVAPFTSAPSSSQRRTTGDDSARHSLTGATGEDVGAVTSATAASAGSDATTTAQNAARHPHS